MSKKHTKYFLVVNEGHSLYIKLESDLTFSDEEGEDKLKKDYPNATAINKISSEKAKIFLGLNKAE